MARRGRSSKSAGESAETGAAAEDRLVEAALALAARQSWRGTGLGEIAREAGLPLGEAYDACPSKAAILGAFHRRIDRMALAEEAGKGDESPRDRLFDVLMRRFDALQPHKAALRSILRDGRGDPRLLLGMPALLCSMAWMLESAGISAAGWRGHLRAHLLAALYFSVFRIFLDDDSIDLARTMAALDRRLRRAESWLGLGGRAAGTAAAAADG
jgi:AcrR family transcriptional regulator